MFQEAVNPLVVDLRYRNERFDSNLEGVRLDIFGNVIIKTAPHWSGASVPN